MTQTEKLEALVQKAIQNEWMAWGIYPTLHIVHDNLDVELRYDDYEQSFQFETYPAQAVIFDHEFTKALFSEETTMFGNIRGEFSNDFDRGRWFTHKDVKEMHAVEYNWGISLPLFQYHLQQAVILPTPSEQIDYMYKAVFGDE